MDELLALLIDVASAGWGVAASDIAIGPPQEEHVAPCVYISWDSLQRTACSGGAVDYVVSGLEVSFLGSPPEGQKGERAKIALANQFLAQLTNEDIARFGLGDIEIRMSDDWEEPRESKVRLTLVFSPAFTVCPG